MSLETMILEDGALLRIAIKGKFDFSLLNDFRQAYADESVSGAKVVVDFRETTSIDSSALGMLLNMKRYLDKADGDIRIMNCNNDVRKILLIARFDKKFTIE